MLANNSVFVVAKPPGEVLATLFDRTDKTFRVDDAMYFVVLTGGSLVPECPTQEISEK